MDTLCEDWSRFMVGTKQYGGRKHHTPTLTPSNAIIHMGRCSQQLYTKVITRSHTHQSHPIYNLSNSEMLREFPEYHFFHIPSKCFLNWILQYPGKRFFFSYLSLWDIYQNMQNPQYFNDLTLYSRCNKDLDLSEGWLGEWLQRWRIIKISSVSLWIGGGLRERIYSESSHSRSF